MVFAIAAGGRDTMPDVYEKKTNYVHSDEESAKCEAAGQYKSRNVGGVRLCERGAHA